jgi:LPS export ABC transporter permease LptG/LPS export ABC transporter permease LptF
MRAGAKRVAEPSAESSVAEPRALRRWRLGPRLSRYVVREIAFPTLFVLAGLTLLAIAADLVGYSDLVVNRGWGAREVAKIALFRTTPLVGRVIPFSVLLGSLVALGRLGADREILALEASGVSARRLAAPVAGFALLFGGAALAITAFAGPWANRALDAALVAGAEHNAGTVLRSGIVNTIGRWRIQAQEVSSRGDQLRGVALYVPSMGETIFAQSAEISPDPSGAKRVLIENGVMLRHAEDGPAYVRFERMQEVMDPEDNGPSKDAADWLSTAPLSELAEMVRSQPEDERRDAAAELQRRFAMPAAVAIFGLLAVPLFLSRGHHSRSAGAVLGLGAIVVYFGLLQLSNGLVHLPAFPLALAVWTPNLALGLVALVLLARTRRPWRSDRDAGRSGGRGAPRAAAERPLRAHRLVLDRYVGVRFAETSALCFAAMLVAFVLIDVIDNLQWFTKYHSTLDEVARFYAARMPLLVARVVPMALLVGAALTVSLLGVTGELLGMRACGVPTLRTVLPILLICGVVALFYQAIVDQVVPHATARASQIKRFEIKNEATEQISVWTRARDRLYEVARIDPLRGFAQGLTVYELGGDGLPRSRTDADEARHVGAGVWQLHDPERIEVGPDGPTQVPADTFTKLGRDLEAEVSSAGLSIRELRHEIHQLERRGYDANTYRVDLQAKLAAPLACVVLPALALLFAVGGPPFPRPAQILVLSAAVGIAHLLLTAVGTSLGYGGAVPPLVAGWGPIAVLFAVAIGLAARVRVLGL